MGSYAKFFLIAHTQKKYIWFQKPCLGFCHGKSRQKKKRRPFFVVHKNSNSTPPAPAFKLFDWNVWTYHSLENKISLKFCDFSFCRLRRNLVKKTICCRLTQKNCTSEDVWMYDDEWERIVFFFLGLFFLFHFKWMNPCHDVYILSYRCYHHQSYLSFKIFLKKCKDYMLFRLDFFFFLSPS